MLIKSPAIPDVITGHRRPDHGDLVYEPLSFIHRATVGLFSTPSSYNDTEREKRYVRDTRRAISGLLWSSQEPPPIYDMFRMNIAYLG
jgi:hypothetical protein